MALNKVEICGVNTSKLPVLNAEEKDELFRRIKEGDEQARELYIKGNLRLVLSVIRRFQNSSENADDLFQIGCIGLIKAIDNFDTTLQVKFSTYAVPMIIGEIRRYLRDNNSIRVSRSLRDIAYKAIYTRENYMKQHLKEPTVAEIAQEIGIEKEMIVYAMDAIQNPVSLFEPVYTEGGDTLYVMDQISDKKNKEDSKPDDGEKPDDAENTDKPGDSVTPGTVEKPDDIETPELPIGDDSADEPEKNENPGETKPDDGSGGAQDNPGEGSQESPNDGNVEE